MQKRCKRIFAEKCFNFILYKKSDFMFSKSAFNGCVLSLNKSDLFL